MIYHTVHADALNLSLAILLELIIELQRYIQGPGIGSTFCFSVCLSAL